MKKWVIVLTILPFLGLLACDGPDEVYKPLPKDFDPVVANGLVRQAVTFEGVKGFLDETRTVVAEGPTVELCTDTELADIWAAMMTKPIIPMVGAAGLDMRGESWDGLTVDEAQSKDMLCQALYVGDGYVIWGDNYEVIGFFDTATREILDMLLWPGYEGTIQAPPYTIAVNKSIDRDGVPMNRTDGSARDPRTEDNMRDMNKALLRAFRPDFPGGPDNADCIDTGSCFVITSGTLPTIVFIDVGLYLPLEPTNLRATQIETALKRPFKFKTATMDVEGPVAEMSGYGSCNITYGTSWSHVRDACIGDDPVEMAQFQPTASSEWLVGDFDGLALYFGRNLGDREIIMLGDMPRDDDYVVGIAYGEQYEGSMTMPLAPTLEIFKQKLADKIRELVGLDETELTGVETLRAPGDPNLPPDVDERYQDRLQPRTIKAAFCTDDGPDPDTRYDSCQEDVNGSKVLLLVKTLETSIATVLGTRMVPTLRERTFYAKLWLESFFEYLNGGPLEPNQATYGPTGRADDIEGTLMMEVGSEEYTIYTRYDGQDDRMGWIQIYNAYNRPETVLKRDAELSTGGTGVLLFDTLIASPRLGLGSSNITLVETVPGIRRAIFDFPMREGETLTALVSYLPASTIAGYWIPQEGAHNEFHSSDYISLGGYTLGAGFYIVPAEDDPAKREVVGIVASTSFGPISFCSQSVELGDWVDDIMDGIVDMGYPCTLIITWSEGETYIVSLASMEDQKKLYFDNDRFYQAFAWLR
jgi:hypothetical protein